MDWSRFSNPFRPRRGPGQPPDLQRALDAVPARVARAVITGARALDQLGEQYALIGGVAVGAHGAPRTTRDVDFLVAGDRVFRRHGGGVVSFAEGVPISIEGVVIDYLEPHAEYIARALAEAPRSHGVAILPVEPLVALKLEANRRQDRVDVGRLIFEGGADDRALADYLRQNEPALLPVLQRAIDEWAEENR
jgi:hypothetical protein